MEQGFWSPLRTGLGLLWPAESWSPQIYLAALALLSRSREAHSFSLGLGSEAQTGLGLTPNISRPGEVSPLKGTVMVLLQRKEG